MTFGTRLLTNILYSIRPNSCRRYQMLRYWASSNYFRSSTAPFHLYIHSEEVPRWLNALYCSPPHTIITVAFCRGTVSDHSASYDFLIYHNSDLSIWSRSNQQRHLTDSECSGYRSGTLPIPTSRAHVVPFRVDSSLPLLAVIFHVYPTSSRT